MIAEQDVHFVHEVPIVRQLIKHEAVFRDEGRPSLRKGAGVDVVFFHGFAVEQEVSFVAVDFKETERTEFIRIDSMLRGENGSS